MEESIFKELDAKTKSRSACTCGTMFALLLVLLMAIIIASLYLIKQVQMKVEITKVNPSQASYEQLIEKLAAYIKSSAKGDRAALEITEQELTTLLVEAAAKDEKFPVRGLQASITQDAIIFSGTLIKPLKSNIIVHALPQANGGKLEFEIRKVSAGRITLPQPLVKLVESKLGDLITKNLQISDNLEVTEVILRRGVMVVR